MKVERTTGILMIVAAVVMVVGMGLHPSNADAVMLGNSVHATMILVLLLSYWGVIQFLRPLGLAKPLISAGLVAYSMWVVTQLVAGTINGFAVPALANADGEPVGRDVFLLAWELNQALVKVGFYAAGAALALWSVALLRDESRAAKQLAGLGFAAGALPPALLLTGVIQMNTGGAFIAYGLHALWIAAVGRSMMSPRQLNASVPVQASA